MILARRRPSDRFTYGLQSASIVAALANAFTLLLALGGIGWEALHRFENPESPITGIIMWGRSYWRGCKWCKRMVFFHGDSHDLNIKGAFLHMAADALVSLGVVISAYIMSQNRLALARPYGKFNHRHRPITLSTWKTPQQLHETHAPRRTRES